MGNDLAAAAFFATLTIILAAAVIFTLNSPLHVGDDFDVVGNSEYVCVINEGETGLELDCLSLGEED